LLYFFYFNIIFSDCDTSRNGIDSFLGKCLESPSEELLFPKVLDEPLLVVNKEEEFRFIEIASDDHGTIDSLTFRHVFHCIRLHVYNKGTVFEHPIKGLFILNQSYFLVEDPINFFCAFYSEEHSFIPFHLVLLHPESAFLERPLFTRWRDSEFFNHNKELSAWSVDTSNVFILNSELSKFVAKFLIRATFVSVESVQDAFFIEFGREFPRHNSVRPNEVNSISRRISDGYEVVGVLLTIINLGVHGAFELQVREICRYIEGWIGIIVSKRFILNLLRHW